MPLFDPTMIGQVLLAFAMIGLLAFVLRWAFSRDRNAPEWPGTDPSGTHPASTPATDISPRAGSRPTSQQSIEPPSIEPPSTEPPGEPPNTEASSTQPSSTQPSSTQPSSTQPSSTQPSSTDPSSTDPSSTDPSSTDPSSTDPSSIAGTDPKSRPYASSAADTGKPAASAVAGSGTDDDFGLLAVAATVATAEEAARVRGVLMEAGIRATTTVGGDGRHRVLVFASDVRRARRVAG